MTCATALTRRLANGKTTRLTPGLAHGLADAWRRLASRFTASSTASVAASVASACAATALLALPQISIAQSFPARPVRIIVPFSTGTAADIVARQLAARLAETWGQGVTVENLQGAGGNVGAVAAAKAAPDGHTLLMLGINHVINPALYQSTGYDLPRDFKPVMKVASAPLVIIAHPAFAASNIAELVALAKTRPGSINYGSGGNGSVTHLSLEMLKSRAGASMVHVPYKGIAQMLTDLMGNQISLASPAVASALPHVKAGRIKALAVTSAMRSSAFPEVPTVAEAGFPDFDVSAWNGLLAPSGTPDEIIAKVYADALRITQTPDFIEQLRRQGMEPDVLAPAAFRAYLGTELIKWAKLVREAGAKLD